MRPLPTPLTSVVLRKSEKLLLALVRDASEPAQRIIDEVPLDFDLFLGLARRHKIAPIALNRLSRLRLPDSDAQMVCSHARRLAIAATAVSMQVRHELQKVTELLDAAGIDSLLLKGFAVSKDPLRRFNDLDLLIREPDLPKAVSTLESPGYRYKGSNILNNREKESPFRSVSWNNQFGYQPPGSQLCIELHTNLFERDRVRLESLGNLLNNVDLFWEGRLWDEELRCFVPAPECTLALLCVHSALKRSPAHNTFILRHSYDIAQILAGGVDLDRFLYLSGVWEIEYYAYVSLRLAADLLESEPARLLSGRLSRRLSRRRLNLARIHLNCFRGLGDASLYYRYLYALYMPIAIGGGRKKSARWYRQLLLPPRWRQETAHGIPRTSPAILLTYLYGPIVRLYRALSRRTNEERSKIE